MCSAERQETANSAAVLIVLIALLSCCGPIATDLYLPALPDMPAYFHTSESMVNFTLVGFFFFMAAGMVVFGPLSDSLGRKRPLLCAVALFAGAALAGAFAPSVGVLVFTRSLEGVGGGGMVAIGTALVKDCFEGRARERALVVVQAISVVGPMASPVLGAAILSFVDWRGTFIAQALLGLAALPFLFALREPLPEEKRSKLGVFASIGQIMVCAKSPALFVLLVICAFNGLPFMAYLSSVSYVYMDIFEVSKFGYSLFFALNAALSAVGAGIVLLVNGRLSPKASLFAAFILSVVGSVALLLFGHSSPLAFFVSFGIYSLAGGYARPISTVILLDQRQGDTGALSSLINFTISVFNTFGMMAAVLPWSDHIWGVAIIAFACTSFSLIGLFALCRSKLKVKGLN